MPLQVEPIEEPSLNLTSMLDIVLLLVFFFMVGTQFAEPESQYEIELPTVSSAVEPLTGAPDELTLYVQRDGQMFLDERPVSPRELHRELEAAIGRYARQVVVIRGDGEGRYQHVMTALDVCRRAGVMNVQLANRIEEGQP